MSKVEAIDSMMKNQSKCECINLNDSEVKKTLLQNEGEFKRECNPSESSRAVVKVRWNKQKSVFLCSINFLEKQKGEKEKCVIRFDDDHKCRHVDVDLRMGRTKMFDGRLALAKVQCPILSEIINSLPRDRAEAWKIKLFDEIVIGNQKRKEYINDPKKIHFY